MVEQVFTLVVGMLLEKGYVKLENYFLDGTKIEADANKYSFVWKKAAKHFKARLQERISELLDHIDEVNDKENREYGDHDLEELGEESSISSEEIDAAVEELNRRLKDEAEDSEKKKGLKKLQEEYLPRLKKYEMQEAICGTRNSYSKTDHDATFMRMKEDPLGNSLMKPAYNVQIGTENQFILNYSIHQRPGDTTTFIPHLDKMKKLLGRLPENIIADAGYGSEENYEYMKQRGIGNYVKFSHYYLEKKRSFKNNPYRVENLPYDPGTDEYTCPADKKLRYSGGETKISDTGYVQHYRSYTCENCKWCRRRKFCHRSKNNRKIDVNGNLSDIKEMVRSNLLSTLGRQLSISRSIEVESVFGHIKQNRRFRRFTLRGIDKVSIEWGLLSIAHNFLKMSSLMA
jgi:transposase